MKNKNAKPRIIAGLPSVPGFVLGALAHWVMEESLAFSDQTPFQGKVEAGDNRLLLIVGENASGKSLAFRIIAQMLQDEGVEAMTLSVRERTGGGTFEMGRMRQALIYGREETSSTGAISVSVVERGFKNLHQREAPSTLCLDEPELGLSNGYAHALGIYIGQEAAKQEGNACGVMVVTHSRELVQGLVEGLGAKPTFVSVAPKGSACAESLESWQASEDRKSVEDLLNLGDISHQRYLALKKAMDKAESR